MNGLDLNSWNFVNLERRVFNWAFDEHGCNNKLTINLIPREPTECIYKFKHTDSLKGI